MITLRLSHRSSAIILNFDLSIHVVADCVASLLLPITTPLRNKKKCRYLILATHLR